MSLFKPLKLNIAAYWDLLKDFANAEWSLNYELFFLFHEYILANF